MEAGGHETFVSTGDEGPRFSFESAWESLLSGPSGQFAEDEDALSSVRSADFRRLDESCRHAVAHAFQVANDVLESKRYVAGDVLEEAPARGDLCDDSLDVRPEVSGVVGALARSRKAEGLAGVTSRDEIHSATPRAAIEG